MKNCKLLFALLALVLFIFPSCSKDYNVSYNEGSVQTANGNASPQSEMFTNITIDSLGRHVFAVPEITQAVLSHGNVTVYAASGSCQEEWRILPIINSCGSRIEVTNLTLGQVEIGSTVGGYVTMSYRVDVVGN
jgi:hypothetical protein